MGDNDESILAPVEADELDSMDRVTPIRRVDSVTTTMVPIHRDLTVPPPPKPERRGMELVLKPFTPVSKQRSMRTMSDLNDMANPPRQTSIAQIRGRHNVVGPIEPAKTEMAKTK